MHSSSYAKAITARSTATPPSSKPTARTSTGLAGYVRERGLTDLYVCGLATDFCVAWTALDGRAAGFDVTVIENACRAIELQGSCARAWQQMTRAGVRMASEQVFG